MRSPPPRPLLALGVLAACAAFGSARARADQAPDAGARPRVAQAGPSNDVPLGRPRADQAPGSDTPAGGPRPSPPPAAPPVSTQQPAPQPIPGPQPPPSGALEPTGSAGPARTTLPSAPGTPVPGPLPPEAGATPPGDEGAPAPPKREPARVTSAPAPAAPDVYLRARKPRPIQLEIGPSLLYASRVTRGDGPSYKDALALSFAARARIAPWLFIGARYRTVAHILSLPPGSFGLPGEEFDDSRRTYVRSLDAYLHPTIQPLDSLRLWATVGLGWGQITLPPILTTKPAEGATLRPRRGVFGEVPLGLGAAYNLPWRWLSVSCEALFEPVFYQEGNMYEPLRYVNRASDAHDFVDASPMPKLRHSLAGVVGISFAL